MYMKGYARELFMVWWRMLGGAAALGLGSCPYALRKTGSFFYFWGSPEEENKLN